MRSLVILAVITLVYAKNIEQSPPLTARGYIKEVAIPLGEEIRKQEEAVLLNENGLGRIAGGSTSTLGQFPYQAGLLTRFIGIDGSGVCGGSLVTNNRVISAAHCWFDGENQGYLTEVVLGSVTLFFGGSRQSTTNFIMHPEWNPEVIRNDVGVIYLNSPVQLSNTIAPIALPSGSELNELYAGEVGVASGFGRTGDFTQGGITIQQTLSHVNLSIITNAECRSRFAIVVDSNICTSGAGGTSTCRGDSGGPLAVTRNGRPVLVGVTSFGLLFGCTLGFPAAFARVSSFTDFFNQHL